MELATFNQANLQSSGPGFGQQNRPRGWEAGTYQSHLSEAQTGYADVMAGYANLLGAQQQAQQNTRAGYQGLQAGVRETLGYGGTPWGVAAPGAQAIADTYAQQQGRSQQGLINSGLGNSTILSAVQRGNALDAAKAYGGLGAQLAQTHAGYQSQLGLAGLGYEGQAQQQNAAVGLNQLGYMGAYHNQGYSLRPDGSGYGGGGGYRVSNFDPVIARGLNRGTNNNAYREWQPRSPYEPQARPDQLGNVGGRSPYGAYGTTYQPDAGIWAEQMRTPPQLVPSAPGMFPPPTPQQNMDMAPNDYGYSGGEW